MTPIEPLVYPGGYPGCLSLRFTPSWLRGDSYEQCYLPRGHEGNHDNLSERRRMTWSELAKQPMPFPCCEHCGCGTSWGMWSERNGHDDTCAKGCNDTAQDPS